MGLYNNRIVVKVGTSTLTNDAGKSDLRTTDRLGSRSTYGNVMAH